MTFIIIPIICILSIIISYLWVKAIDRSIKYYNDHPDENPAEGWLDWENGTVNKTNQL